MATCVRCGTETELHDNGVPICVACTEDTAGRIKQDQNVSQFLNDIQLGLPHG